jgi:hypothetical protein
LEESENEDGIGGDLRWTARVWGIPVTAEIYTGRRRDRGYRDERR